MSLYQTNAHLTQRRFPKNTKLEERAKPGFLGIGACDYSFQLEVRNPTAIGVQVLARRSVHRTRHIVAREPAAAVLTIPGPIGGFGNGPCSTEAAHINRVSARPHR